MPEINWGALQQPDYFGNALRGAQAGRQDAGLAALKNYATDPSGTINALISTGNVQGAQELAQLGYQQQQRELLTDGAKALFGRKPQAQPASQPQTAPQAPAPTAQAPNAPPPPAANQPAPVDPAVAVQKLDTLGQAADQLSQLPYEQRKQALQQMAPQLTQIGFTSDQLAQFDPSDQNLAAVHQQVAQVHSHLGTQPGQGSAPQAPPVSAGAPASPQPPAGAPAPQDDASPIDLRDPDTVRALGEMTLGNPQMGQALTALGTASMPQYDAGRPGAVIYDKRTGRLVAASPNSDGIQLDVQDGHVTGAHETPGYREAQAGTAGAIAGARKGAEEAASAPYEMVDVQMPDGSHQQMPLSDARTLMKYGAAGKMGFGRSITPGDETYQKLDAENFGKEVDAHGAGAILPMQTARSNTEQAIKLAQSINPNAWTEQSGHVASMLSAIPGIGNLTAKQASDVATYHALTQQVLRGSFTTFPRLEKEFEVVQKAAANVNTPKDAALVLLGSQAAVADKNLAYANFVQGWQGPKSKQAMTQAFLKTPAAQASIFADPIWRNLTIGGKPAVMVGSQPYKDGHIYGVFRPGTPQAQTFLVQ